jgi:cyanate permease
LIALCFAFYSSQWLAVIGFLPSIYAQAGTGGRLAGALTAFATLVNTVGNVAAGRLLQRGAAAQHLLYAGFAAMIVGAFGLYGLPEAPPALRYGAVLLLTTFGGLVPGTLFYLAVRVAPSERAVPTTVGWMQQLVSCGLFAGPPLAAWVAERAGGWHWTWVLTGAAALAGMLLAARLGALLRR